MIIYLTPLSDVKAVFLVVTQISQKNTIFKITNSNNSTISSLKASRTLFYERDDN